MMIGIVIIILFGVVQAIVGQWLYDRRALDFHWRRRRCAE